MNRIIGLVFLLQLCLVFETRANHILGGHIAWECEGNDSYGITLTIYKDCFGNTGDPSFESVFLLPSECGGFPESAYLDFQSATEISDLCDFELANSSCAGGFLPGTSQVVYSASITLQSGCIYQLVWNNGDWNYFSNINFISQNAYISATINTNFTCENAPLIESTQSNPQIEYVCINTPVSHALPIINAEGLTLSYSLNPSLTTGSAFDAPVIAEGFFMPEGLSLNGDVLNWTPDGLGNYAFSIEIIITDGINYLGTIHENMCFVVRNCPIQTTTFQTPPIVAVGAQTIFVDDNRVRVCVGDSLQFSVQAESTSDLQNITLEYDAIQALPFHFEQQGTNPVMGTFSLTITEEMVSASPYSLHLYTSDNGCEFNVQDELEVIIEVSPQVDLITEDTTICRGNSIILEVAGVNDLSWSVLSGGDPNVLNDVLLQTVTPDMSTTYVIASASVAEGCRNTDTCTIQVAFLEVVLFPVNATCGNQDGRISMEISGVGSGNYDFDWTGLNAVDGQQDQQQLTGGVGQNYSVTVTDNEWGCIAQSSTNLLTEICPGETDAGTMSSTPLVICGAMEAAATWNSDGYLDENDQQIFILHTAADNSTGFVIAFDCDDAVFGDDDSPLNFGALTASGIIVDGTTYYISSVVGDSVFDYSCVDLNNSTTRISIGQPVTWFAPALIELHSEPHPAIVCEGQAVSITVHAEGTGNWNVSFSVDGDLQSDIVGITEDIDALISGYDAGAYCIVEALNDRNSCPVDYSECIQVSHHPLPTAELSGSVSICSGEVHCFDITTTGEAPFSVVLNTPSGIELISTEGLATTWCDDESGNYQILSVSDGNNCTNNETVENVELIVYDLPDAHWLDSSDSSMCSGGCATLLVNCTGAYPFDLTISGADPFLNPESLMHVDYEHSLLVCEPGNYIIESVTDDHGCTSVLSEMLQLQEYPLPQPSFEFPESIVFNSDGYVWNFQCDTPDINSFHWDLGDGTIEEIGAFEHEYSAEFLGGIEELIVSLTVTDENGCQTLISDSASVIPSAIQESGLIEMNISPNPASTELLVQSDVPILCLTIYDTFGRVVLSSPSNKSRAERIDLSTIMPGAYLLKVNSEGKKKFARFFVVK